MTPDHTQRRAASLRASRCAVLAGALAALAACGGRQDEAPAAATPSAPASGAPASASPPATPAPPVADATPPSAPLQVADIEAYRRGMERENALLRAEFAKLLRARDAGDADAETNALFAMTSGDIDLAGAQAAGMTAARYGAVKDRIDEVQSKLEMLAGFRAMAGDTTSLQAQLGDPYAAFAADVAAALKTQQPKLAELRAEAVGLRLKAAGG